MCIFFFFSLVRGNASTQIFERLWVSASTQRHTRVARCLWAQHGNPVPSCEDGNRRGSEVKVMIHECWRPPWWNNGVARRQRAAQGHRGRGRRRRRRRATPPRRGREQTILTGSLSRRFALPLNRVCPARGPRTQERGGQGEGRSWGGTTPPPAENAPSHVFFEDD